MWHHHGDPWRINTMHSGCCRFWIAPRLRCGRADEKSRCNSLMHTGVSTVYGTGRQLSCHNGNHRPAGRCLRGEWAILLGWLMTKIKPTRYTDCNRIPYSVELRKLKSQILFYEKDWGRWYREVGEQLSDGWWGIARVEGHLCFDVKIL